MRHYIFILFFLFGITKNENVYGQKQGPRVDIEDFRNFKLEKVMAEEVRVISPGVAWKNVKVKKRDACIFLIRNYLDPTLITKFVDSYNDGCIIVIGQFDKFEPVRYFTVHLDYSTKKIEAIDIDKMR